MNPVLLKPQSETGSQIIVHGKVWGAAKGSDYQRLKPRLLERVLESWHTLNAEADIVIAEGAGSPAEINLRPGDIANMGFARAADVPVVLVGDIDRGGVIASIAGTHTILDPADREMICGYIINKFRGDVSLFDGGIREIERFTNWPCFGVVPWLEAASRLPAEDSVTLERLARSTAGTGGIKVAVPVLGRIANFDDIDPLKNDPAYEVRFIRSGESIPRDTKIVILPGSKSTIADIEGFRANGWERDLHELREAGAEIIGICGGYQILGRMVRDPLGIEGPVTEIRGLGLLDTETVMEPEKTVRNVHAISAAGNREVAGYEIHLGRTSGPDCTRPVAYIGERPDGATSADGKVWGTYLHGSLSGFLSIADTRQAADAALDEIADSLEAVLEKDFLLRFASQTGRNHD
jgi:adenosylcobyric acid synthase